MTNHRRYKSARTPRKPADTAEGALYVRKFMLKLFDREDGKAADWLLIAETLLREAFHALDQSPDDPRSLTLLRAINDGSYDRLTRFPTDRHPSLEGQYNEASNMAELRAQPDHDEGTGTAFRSMAVEKDQL